jgi:hypothetical protein
MLGQQLVLVTPYRNLQIVLSKTFRIVTLDIEFSVFVCIISYMKWA